MPLESSPYLPSTLQPLVAEMWNGVRTDTNRVGVPEGYDYWLDGFFPFAPRRLRALPDLGASIYTASGILTIIFYKFVNLGFNPLCIVVLSDGSVVQLNTNTSVVTTILPASTITNPLQTTVDINQWGASYILIVAAQTNGYWIWDGALLYQAGSLGPVITLTNVGSGYTSAPLVTASGGHGSGAAFTAYLNGTGGVGSVVMTSPGSGYLATDTVTLNFFGGLSAGSGASLTASLTHLTGGSGAVATISAFNTITSGGITYFAIKTIAVSSVGSGYSNFTKVSPTGGATFTPAVLNPSVTGGQVVSVSISSGGLFTTKPNVTLAITDTGGYAVGSVSVVAPGSGYSNFPVVTYTVAAGQSLTQSPVFTPVITNGTFTSVSVVSGGLQSGSVAGTLVVTDTAVAAAGSVFLAPFGIQGNAVETYSGQVWIANGANRYTSAPGSVTDFATSDGGLSVQDNDSFLKIGYTRFIQMNGFLWMVADCSVNYIGNVTTTGSPPVTNYSKQNADPEVGTIWPNTVIPWGNQLLLANSWGVFLGLGSRMQKVSDELDGVYGTVLNPAITPSVAKMTLFNRKIVFLLFPIVDPVSGTQQNKLLCWDGKKWWASTQSKTLTYIATQEINSVLTAFGTDGTKIYPLFTTASSAFTKTLQTRLWDAPGSYLVEKAAGRLFGVARYNSTVTPNLTIRLDNESTDTGSTMSTTSTYTITGPTVTGNFVLPPQAIGQTGVFTGLTLQTTAADIEIVSLAIADEIVGYRG